MYILLDIKNAYVPTCYVRILGFNKIGRKYFKSIKDDITLPIVNNYSSNKELLSLEYKANSIYALKTKDVNKTINLELNKIIEK